MGSLHAQAFAAEVEDGNIHLNVALSWHLSSNHFPPLPDFFLATAREAIEAGKDEDWDREIDLPVGCAKHGAIWAPQDGTPEAHKDCVVNNAISWRDGRETVTAAALIESFHLDAFL